MRVGQFCLQDELEIFVIAYLFVSDLKIKQGHFFSISYLFLIKNDRIGCRLK